VAVELPSATKREHSVLTEQRHEPSVQQVLGFLREKLHRPLSLLRQLLPRLQ
jgi:hypothetical protein